MENLTKAEAKILLSDLVIENYKYGAMKMSHVYSDEELIPQKKICDELFAKMFNYINSGE